jgi:hypothetical protein
MGKQVHSGSHENVRAISTLAVYHKFRSIGRPACLKKTS